MEYIYKNKTYKSLMELSNELNINYNTLYKRINEQNLSVKEAIENPIDNIKRVIYKNKSYTINQLSKLSGISKSTLNYRLGTGMTPEEAMAKKIQGYKGITYKNITYNSLVELSDDIGVNAKYVGNYLRQGFTIDESIQLYRDNIKNPITYKGITYDSITNLALDNDLSLNLILKMIELHKEPEKALIEYHKYTDSKKITLWDKQYNNINEIEKAFGIPDGVIVGKYYRNNTSLEDLVIECLNSGIVLKGIKYKSLTHACNDYNIFPNNVILRLKIGWSLEDAILTPVNHMKGKTTIYKNESFISKTELLKTYNLGDKYIFDISKRTNKSWLDSFDTIVSFLDDNKLSYHKNKPNIISKTYYVIYNDLWLDNLRDFTNACGVTMSQFKSIFETQDDISDRSEALSVMDLVKNKKINKYRYKNKVYNNHIELKKVINSWDVYHLIDSGEIEVFEELKFPNCTFEMNGFCLNYKYEFNNVLDNL